MASELDVPQLHVVAGVWCRRGGSEGPVSHAVASVALGAISRLLGHVFGRSLLAVEVRLLHSTELRATFGHLV